MVFIFIREPRKRLKASGASGNVAAREGPRHCDVHAERRVSDGADLRPDTKRDDT